MAKALAFCKYKNKGKKRKLEIIIILNRKVIKYLFINIIILLKIKVLRKRKDFIKYFFEVGIIIVKFISDYVNSYFTKRFILNSKVIVNCILNSFIKNIECKILKFKILLEVILANNKKITLKYYIILDIIYNNVVIIFYIYIYKNLLVFNIIFF